MGELLTEPKLKSDKDAGLLSETAKNHILDVWLKNEFEYVEEVLSDDMLKGILCEQESMALVTKVLRGEFRRRYGMTLSNDYISGTPDCVLEKEDYVEDIKTCSTLRTFMKADPTKLYETQAQCYMALTGKSNFRLIYCLVKTPDSIIASEKTRWYYKFGCKEDSEDYMNVSLQIDHNNNLIEKISPERRLKIFRFKADPQFMEHLYSKIEKAREYYKTLSLPDFKASMIPNPENME